PSSSPAGGFCSSGAGTSPRRGAGRCPGGGSRPGEPTRRPRAPRGARETARTGAPAPRSARGARPAPAGRGRGVGANPPPRRAAAPGAGGARAAGEDADDAGWFGGRDLAGLSLSTGLEEALNEWGVLGRLPSPALIAEATRRAGVIWLAVPGRDKPFPAWHLWRDPPGAAYLVTRPGEQPLPGLAGAGRVTVTVPSKDTGGALVTWTAGVHRVEPGSAEWAAVIGPLAAGRLNADLDPGLVTVYRLAPQPPAGPRA